LVLGDAAVKAGIVSADLIVVIAFTAVANFIVPSLNEVITLYRFILLILAGIIGIYGITAGTFVMLMHANSLKSFGVPYLSPVSPVNIEGLKDFIIRFPLQSMKKRPKFISGKNKKKKS
jgi:spore germination protein KA